jgi:integrase
MGANTGQRGSDLVKMRWTDIEEVQGRPGVNVVQQKTGLKIWVPFTKLSMAAMATWERQPGMILRKYDGLPFDNRQQLTDAWVREREKPEMEPLRHLHLHGLRGTAVVRLRRSGASIPEITSMVGMSQAMVERYCRFSIQRENALAAVERLDASKQQSNVLKFK